MNMLFIEPDVRFYDWLTANIRNHACDRAADADEAESKLMTGKFSACFLDISQQSEKPCLMIARVRSCTNGIPLILLTGKELRADLVKICDKIIERDTLTPANIEAVTRQAQDAHKSLHTLDATAQIISAVSSLRRTAQGL